MWSPPDAALQGPALCHCGGLPLPERVDHPSRRPAGPTGDLHILVRDPLGDAGSAQHDSLCPQESLAQVLETVELGLSGSRSRQEQEVRCKEEKELSPASLRVKEAAEATLSWQVELGGLGRVGTGREHRNVFNSLANHVAV